MTEEQLARIKDYVEVISDITVEGNGLLDFVIAEVVDRTLLYLNDIAIDVRIERVVARVVVSTYKQTDNTKTNTGADLAISSVSDNGQSVSYKNEVTNYLSTAEDGELFSGFAKLLASYRRPHVIAS